MNDYFRVGGWDVGGRPCKEIHIFLQSLMDELGIGSCHGRANARILVLTDKGGMA